MKLFISYSRDDGAWVYELWRKLRDEEHHDAWIDRHIISASDWWISILENIEEAQCFVYVMTPQSVASIYCTAEMEYALALNKPILPLMLKTVTYPSVLSKRRIQYETINNDMSLDKVLLKMEKALGEIRVGIERGQYHQAQASRPDVPKPKRKPEQLSEVFLLAEEAVAANNVELGEALFQQIIDTDPNGWGLAANERLVEAIHNRDRDIDYQNIVAMASNPKLLSGAKAAWRVFVTNHLDYDPQNLAEKLKDNSTPVISRPSLEAGLPQTQITPKAVPVVEKSRLQKPEPQPLVSAEEWVNRGRGRPETDYQGRIDDFTQAIKSNPRYAIAYTYRAGNYVLTGKMAEAIKDCDKAIQLNPQDAGAYYNRAFAHYQQGRHRYDKAIADLTQSAKLNPTDASAFYTLSELHREKKDFELAVEYSTKGIQLNPHDVHAYFYARAQANAMLNKYQEAIEDYSKVIDLSPSYPGVYTRRAGCYLCTENWDAALNDCDLALRQNWQDAGAYYNRANVYYAWKEWHRVTNDLLMSINLGRRDASAYYYLGIAYLNRGVLDDAFAELTYAFRLNRRDENALNKRGEIRCIYGDYKRAIDDFEAALRIKPDFEDAQKNLDEARKKLHGIDPNLTYDAQP